MKQRIRRISRLGAALALAMAIGGAPAALANRDHPEDGPHHHGGHHGQHHHGEHHGQHHHGHGGRGNEPGDDNGIDG